MAIRRIGTIGNSVGVTLPPAYLEAVGLAVGDDVDVQLDREARRLIVQRVEPLPVSPAFVAEARAFAERHRDVLLALAKR